MVLHGFHEWNPKVRGGVSKGIFFVNSQDFVEVNCISLGPIETVIRLTYSFLISVQISCLHKLACPGVTSKSTLKRLSKKYAETHTLINPQNRQKCFLNPEEAGKATLRG